VGRRLVREIAVGAGAGVVFVDYALSPEANYPTAIEQAYAATRWVAGHGLPGHRRPVDTPS
jgi:acetyl esterase/lipase